ncbi:MAG: insulinase family protein [Candidatus Tectomicrobia bacterium]|uniref:Insulinase family protein n=1 Tax=Tectimicrobiota bacterium TaxID=2528274 RepID=A0A932HXK9_UNCTE|nr:insulinase family protein [Candidatus Tectomicrobia bacterium]
MPATRERLFRAFFLALLLAGLLAPGASRAALRYDREELPGGAVLLVKESPELPMVNVQISLDAGSRREPPGKAGLAQMTASLLARGAAGKNALEIAKLNDALGGGAGVSAGRDHVTASLKVLTRDLEEGAGLLADILRRPAFPPDEIEKTRSQTLGSLRKQQDRPGYLAGLAFRRELYGNTAEGRQVEGSPETVPLIRREDIQAFHRNWYGMKGAIFVFVGDITLQRARDIVLQHFQGWEAKGGEAPSPPLPPAPKGLKAVKVDRPLTQATVVLGNRSLTRKNPDFYAARVMNYILGGGGFESWLMNNLREQKGLVYGVYSMFESDADSGLWRLVLQTKNESANQAIDESLVEVRRMQESGISEQQLEEAKAFITGSFATQFSSSGRIADFILSVERLGFDPGYADRYPQLIRAVTREQVQEAARKHIKLDEAVLAVVGNMAEAKLKR